MPSVLELPRERGRVLGGGPVPALSRRGHAGVLPAWTELLPNRRAGFKYLKLCGWPQFCRQLFDSAKNDRIETDRDFGKI